MQPLTVLTRSDFDERSCQACGCDHGTLVLSSSCHPRAAIVPIYDKANGVLRLHCSECSDAVVGIAVASTWPAAPARLN